MPPKTGKYKEDLIPRIRGLIDEYSSASILKEYLQNADDSGATELIVTFDKQNYQKLKGTKYELAMGASLLLSNNSIFKEKDFDSIVQISAQGKSSDASSTGRFGQGFSSSFSISDHPTFLSNNRVYWFDVLKTAISKDEDDDILHWEDSDFHEILDWLKTFEVAGFNYLKPYHGTIFRLPLRNIDNNSKISHDIFSFDNFLSWCEEWKDKSENLLFLRNIHTLILQEIDGDGNRIVHVEIKTTNSDKIQNINNSIQNEFGNDKLIDICNRWKSTNGNLPLFRYHHKFSISYLDRKNNVIGNRHETWAVVNGLFRGKNNSLIDKAIEVLRISSNPRKVLPWAGVALSLDNDKKPIKKDSQWYTFLPLPINSAYPVQLHGWFDVNQTRTKITLDGTGDNKETLISWNQQLLEYGVGAAWALLIDYIKDEKHLNSYYDFWAKKESNALDSYLIKGFYQQIFKLDCFYVHNKNDEPKWLSPKENLYYFKDENNKQLFEAFKKHFSIISPKPNKTIIDNFENIDIDLTEITSEYIRDFINEKAQYITFPISLNNIPLDMLKNKKSLIEIIKYCADNGENYDLLDGLPFALTLDNHIDIIGAHILFDKKPNLKLFQEMKYLYMDIDIVNSVEEVDALPSSWLEPTLKNQLLVLLEYWEDFKLSREWIKEVVYLIVNSTQEEFKEAKDDVKELQLIYQKNEEYGKLESDISKYSPFMPRSEDIKNNLVFLDEIGSNMVHSDYIEVYKPLLKYDGLLTELNSKNLLQHLLLLGDFSFFENKNTREYILDILVEDITWFDQLSIYELDKLNSIAFIQTVNDNLYAKDTGIKLFLPTDFTPPEHIESLKGEYELISVDTSSKLFEVYKKMEIEEQSLSNYIQEVIIPFLKTIDNISDNREVLKWLAVEWNSVKDGIGNEILHELMEANIIPSLLDEDNLYKASELYMPTIELPEILNDNKYKPIYFEDEKIQEDWATFLKDLESSILILPQHIEDKVAQIVEDNNPDDSITLLNYIANNFEIFEEMGILDTLKKYAWFPVEKPNDILKPKSEYTKLKRVDELILFDDLKIAGGYYHVLDRKVNLGKKDEKRSYTEKDMAEKLGIILNIPNESFFESFRELMKLSPTDGKVVNYAKEVYTYIGRRFKGQSINFDIEERTILINNQWIASKYIYQCKINLTDIYSWENLIGDKVESPLAKGLISLGVQDKPTFNFFIEQLQNLPQEQDLNSDQLKDAKALLDEIQNENESLIYDELPILTGYNQLFSSSKLYINDFPAYKKSSDRNSKLHFCQTKFDGLAKRLNVLSLSQEHSSRIYSHYEVESRHEIIDILKRASFKEAILRLLYHDGRIKKDEINESALDKVVPSKLTFVNKLIIEYTIEDEFLFRSNETTYSDNEELYILEQDDEDDMIEVIAKYICDTKNLLRDSFGWIERILRNRMSREEIHDFLDKKKVIELPQKFDIEDEVSIFDNSHSIELDEEMTYDVSTKHEEDDVEVNNKSKGEIAPPIKPKVSHEDDSAEQEESYEEENTESNGEIAPPIKPKISSKNTSTNNQNTSERANNVEKVNKGASNYSSNKSNTNIVSSNDRKPVYVGKDKELDEEQERTQRESAKEIGDKGENYILSKMETLLLSPANNFQKAPTNNKGFDIFEIDESGQIVRYIEVKTLTGRWAEGGVGITEHQLAFAQEKKDKWWLFVVENINTDSTTIYPFKNPILEANRFMFDSSWKQLAYQSEEIEDHELKVDDKYEIEVEGIMIIGRVTNVKQRGALFQVDLALENGKELKKKKFNKSWRKIDV